MNAAAALAPVVAATVGEADWFALLDRDLQCVHLQRGSLGRVPETLLGVGAGAAAGAGLSATARTLAGAALGEQAAQETELGFMDPRFGPRRFEFDFRPLRSGNELVGVLVRSSESTNRRMQARALRLQTRLLEVMTDAVLVIDARRVIRYANPACEALFAPHPGGLVGQPLRALGDVLAGWLESARGVAIEDAPGLAATLALEGDVTAQPRRVVRCRTATLAFDAERHDLVVIRDVTEVQRLERGVLEAERRERERLARDMHDGLGQELTAVTLMLRALAAERAPGEPQFAARMQPVIDIVGGIIRSTRAMASGIFARPATELGLPAALEQLAQTTSRRTRVAVECRVDLPLGTPLDATRADHLYHIAQEALTNALRHASARRIVIELGQDVHGLRLAVLDDGCGIAPARAHQGLGLRIMQYRARAAGGELRIGPRDPQGTRVEFRATSPDIAVTH